MAQLDLYIDVFNQSLIAGLQGQSANLPQLYQGDTPTLRIFLCNPTFDPRTPYTLQPIGGLSLEVAIGDKQGTGGTVYTSQLVWAPSSDPNQPNYFIATLPLNTAPINTKLGASASFGAWFQVVYQQNGVQTTVLEIPCTVNASVIQNGGVIVPPGLTPLSAEYANATFLTRVITGGITWVNPNTGKRVFQYLGDDNTIHEDPIN